MLHDDFEREIMMTAIQPWLRGDTHPGGEDLAIDRHLVLIEDFTDDEYFKGKRILELGPGQCDFLDIARERGAETFGVDFDPAVVQLGWKRGHTMAWANLSEGWPLHGLVFDGIYSRVSMNIYWYKDVDNLHRFLDAIAASLAPGGWLFFVPFNQPYDHARPEAVRAAADAWARRHGIEVLLPDPAQQEHWMIDGYEVPRREIWHRSPQPTVTGQDPNLLTADPWQAARSSLMPSRIGAPGSTARPGPRLARSTDKPDEDPIEAAFAALSAGEAEAADALFADALQRLPPPQDDRRWVTSTAFAAMAATRSASVCEQMLAGGGIAERDPAAVLPLPARTNLLAFCLARQRIDLAVKLVDGAGPAGCAEEDSFEVWAFRLAVLAVLHRAGRHDELVERAEAYLLRLPKAELVPPGARQTIAFLILLRVALITRQSDARRGVERYRQAMERAEGAGALCLHPDFLTATLLLLGRYHQTLPFHSAAQGCFERCTSLAGIDGKRALLHDLGELASLFTRDGRHAEAEIVHRRRLALVGHDLKGRDLVERLSARLDYAGALLAGDDKAAGESGLDQLIADCRGAGVIARELLFETLLARAEFAAASGAGCDDAWARFDDVIALETPSLDQLDKIANCIQRLLQSGLQPPADALLTRIAESATCIGGQDDTVTAPRQRLAESLLALEISMAEASLTHASVSELAPRVAHVLDRRGRLGFPHRFALVRLAERTLREGRATVGIRIVAALTGLPLPTEPDPHHLLGAELYLRLADLTLNYMPHANPARRLAKQGLVLLADADVEGAAALRLGLRQSLTGAEIRLAELMLPKAPEAVIRRRVAQLLGYGERLPFEHRFTLVRIAERALRAGPAPVGAWIVTTLAGLPLPTEPDPHHLLGAELYLRLADLTLNYTPHANPARRLAKQGLVLLADADVEGAAVLRLRLRQSLTGAEIRLAELMLPKAPEAVIRRRVAQLLGYGERLLFEHRYALVRLAERALREGPAPVGAWIVATLATLPPPAEPNPSRAARLGSELHLYLSNLALNVLNDQTSARTLAQRGLASLADNDGGEWLEGVRQGLLHNLAECGV